MAMHPSRQAYVEDKEMTYDLSNVPTDTDYALPAAQVGAANTRASEVYAEFDRKRAANAIAVPTDDVQVRRTLRELDEPMTLFGERPEDRRDRLRAIMYRRQQGANGDIDMDESSEDEAEEADQEFYTTGSKELLEARKALAKFSLPRTKRRIEYQKLESEIPLNKHVQHRNTIRNRLSKFELFGSQVAGERPVGMARFAPSGEIVAAGNWGGTIRLLDVPNLEQKAVLRGHQSQVSGISWFPGATLPGSQASEDSVHLASGGGEGDIHLWSLTQETPLSTLSGHSGRVCRVDFHPSGRYLASASYDTTWRLWDVETSAELLLQEGHSKEAFAVSFNQDGSLLASAGLDSIACLWDVRTGRRILYFESHIQPIYGLDWSVDGYRIMTGSGDGFAKCWDIRQMKETASIGAHKGGVSDLRWFRGVDGPAEWEANDMIDSIEPKKAGSFFVSSGFDKCVNIFSSDDWVLCNSLTGHSGNVLSVDVTSDARWIVSSGHDRTVKLWARDDMDAL